MHLNHRMLTMTQPIQSDQELLTRYKNGDMAAFQSFYQRHKGPVYSFILSIVKNRDSADEAFQNAFQYLVRKIQQADPIHNVKSFLFKVAKSEAYLVLRNQVITNKYIKFSSDPVLVEMPSEWDPFYDPLLESEKYVALNKAILDLPDEQREVVLLKIKSKMTYVEIGHAMSIPEKTAASRYRYAVHYLKKTLQGDSDHE